MTGHHNKIKQKYFLHDIISQIGLAVIYKTFHINSADCYQHFKNISKTEHLIGYKSNIKNIGNLI